MKKILLAPLFFLTLAACGGDAEPGADATPATVGTAGAPGNSPTGAAPAPARGFEDMGEYRLTLGTVRRWYDAHANIYRAIGQNPDLADELDFSSGDASIDAMEARIDGTPELRAAIGSAGMEVREYVIVLLTLSHARSAVAQAEPDATPESISRSRGVLPENVEFVRQNRAELERRERELEAMEQM